MLGDEILNEFNRLGAFRMCDKRKLERVRWEMTRAVTRKERFLKTLQRDLNRLGWRITLEGLRATRSTLVHSMMFYEGNPHTLRRILESIHYRIACGVFYGHVRQLKRILRKGQKSMDKVDALIAKRSLNPIRRPADFAAPDVRGAYKENSDTAKEKLDAAYAQFDQKLNEWSVCIELMGRQIELVKNGKDDVSAEDDKRSEEEKNRQKCLHEEERAKNIVLGGKSLSVKWDVINNVPFDAGRIEDVVAFKEGWLVLTYSGEFWFSSDGYAWELLSKREQSVSSFQAVGDQLVYWGPMEEKYYHSVDGRNWRCADFHQIKWMDMRKLFFLGNKWILAINGQDKAERVIGRGVLKRTVKADVKRTLCYTSDSMDGPWEECEALKTKDGYYANLEDAMVRSGKLYAPIMVDDSFWAKFKEKVPDSYLASTRELDGWHYESNAKEGLEKMCRFGTYGAKFNWGATWAELTMDGIDYASMFLGECASRFAVSGDRILKVLREQGGGRLVLGKLCVE